MRFDNWCCPGRVTAVIASTVLMTGCSPAVRETPPPTPSRPPVPVLDPAQVARGREIYLQSCARCHGPKAEGAPHWRQPDARGDLPAPPHDDSGHTWRHSDAQLADMIRNGLRDPFNKTPELTMPSFQGHLTDAQIADVIVYFKSLWSAEHRTYQEEQNHGAPMPQPGRMP
jgi:mono/diheme cytochrome c family protein